MKFQHCHGEERSDVAIHLEIFVDCRSRQASFAMTNLSSLTGVLWEGMNQVRRLRIVPKFAHRCYWSQPDSSDACLIQFVTRCSSSWSSS